MDEKTFEKARNEWVDRVHTEENAKILLQDVYEFLESENRHFQIEALEKLTGILYE